MSKLSSFLVLTLFTFLFAQVTLAQQTEETKESCQEANDLLSKNQFEKAIAALNRCFGSDTLNEDYLKNIAICSFRLGKFHEAKSAYQTILKSDSNNVNALSQLAKVYLREDNYNQSMQQYFKLIEIDSTNSYYYKQFAALALQKGDVPGAIAFYDKTLELNEEDIEAITALSRIYQVIRLYPTADSLIRRGRALDSSNVKLLFYQANSAYKQRDYPAVISSVNEILEASRDTTTQLLKLLGVSYFHEKEYQSSINTLQKIIDRDEESEVVYYYFGLAYREVEDLKKSTYHFEKAIDKGISDNISTYYTDLAVTLEERGDYAESIKAYQAAYKSSKDKILLYHLARNYDAYYKNKETALRYYELYLSANDTGNVRFKDYSKHRISELKRTIHFDLDTLEQ